MKKIISGIARSLFPELYTNIRDARIKKFRQENRKSEYEQSSAQLRACHFHELFINHEGYVFPCCLVWGKDHMRIGHIDDIDLMDKIKKFKEYCFCEKYKLVHGKAEEVIDYELLNIELSLACNGKCALCCVCAPDWHGTYDYYDSLTELIGRCKPKIVRVQGGEVLVQQRSMEWMSSLRKKFSDIRYSIITNGNAGADTVKRIESLFDEAIISMMGFQPETYRKIMGLDVEVVKNTIAELVRHGKVDVMPKYLITPLNLHEVSLYIAWCLSAGVRRIEIYDSGTRNYVNWNTEDQFWQKVAQRSLVDIKKILVEKRQEFCSKRIVVIFGTEALHLFGLDKEFVITNNLQDVFAWGILSGGVGDYVLMETC